MTRGRTWCDVVAAAVPAVSVLAVSVLAVSVLGACTVDGAEHASGAATASAVVRPGVPTAPPAPVMTPVEAAARCTMTRPLSGRGRLPLDAVFPGAESSASSDPSEVVPGADAADRAKCPGELPTEPRCEGLVPWTGLSADAFVAASGARRLVQGYLLTMPKLAGNQAPPESSAGTKAVTFSLVDLAAGDPAGFVAYLEGAFADCASPTRSTVAGAAALVGTVRSEYGAGTAQVVLLHRGSHVVWASIDGSGWKAGEQRRALAVLVQHLL
ncbi:MAG: hypothetical protein ACKOVB_19175 [Terrabacter sp.]